MTVIAFPRPHRDRVEISEAINPVGSIEYCLDAVFGNSRIAVASFSNKTDMRIYVGRLLSNGIPVVFSGVRQ